MNVRVCGPNLNDQSLGSFHVHEASCGDLTHYGPGRPKGGDMPGEREMLVRNATVKRVVNDTYGDIISERLADDENLEAVIEELADDFHFFPCCRAL